MVPSPENDSAPKAPDKSGDKARSDGQENVQQKECSAVDGDSKDASVSRLDDRELKALLDEAINYKSPKDRQGKSRLFNNLLTEAEDDLRNARATSASGPQLARYYNQSASKRHRNRRQANSISENLTHGGSLNNLAKEELYEAAIHLQKPKKTVSARQREGGSLPCNVNVGASYDRQFFEEARKKEKEKSKVPYPVEMEAERSLDHELLITSDIDSDYRLPTKYLKNATIHEPCVNTTNCTVPTLDKGAKAIDNTYPKGVNYEPLTTKINGTFPVFTCRRDEKKVVDENCNALGMGLNQKKKIKKKPMEKNVNIFTADVISGHRGDIINDVDKLIDFIDGNDNVYNGQKLKSSVQKSQKINKNIFDEGKANRKQKTRSKGKGNNLQKSNSLEEMPTATLEDFEFLQEEGKVALRQTKSNTDKPRERRSWGNSEQIQVQSLYNVSVENLETADFRVVTKKKKSKKRRSSLSSRRQAYSREEHVNDFNRVPSPEPRRKSAISVPHSEKSNDSSDVDSVHSLPIDANRLNMGGEDEDAVNFPISYADIAKNSANQLDKPKWNRPSVEKKKTCEKKCTEKNVPTSPDSDGSKNEVFIDTIPKKKSPDEKNKSTKQTNTSQSPPQQLQISPPKTQDKATSIQEDRSQALLSPPIVKHQSPPELTLVNYMTNFPSIPSKEKNNVNDQQLKVVKNIVAEIQNWPAISSNNNNINNGKGFDKNINRVNAVAQNQQKNQRNLANHFKNAKNVAVHSRHDKQHGNEILTAKSIIYSHDGKMIQTSERSMSAICGHQPIPFIQDVRTLEKRLKNQPKVIPFQAPIFCQLQKYPGDDHPPPIQLQQHQLPVVNEMVMSPNGNSVQCEAEFVANNNVVVGNIDCDRTTNNSSNNNVSNNSNNNNRPAVVILSGNGDKEVSGITFGFDINEQLLSDDVCADFLARFVPPKDCDITNGFNLDKIVNFIGVAWEDIIRETNGTVKYYTDEL
ncbi:hypothetical protein Trydic_g2437 [Trypoxylus dichotomus]